jgi:hypothetical protein
VKYKVATAPPTRQPAHLGTPATTFNTQARAISCPARMASAPNQSSSASTARTPRP